MTENKRCDVVIAGVGGQGILLASSIIGAACIGEGLPVRGSETHGMSQRGGSVEAHVRIGCEYGPRVPRGKADVFLAFEPLEAARFAGYLKEGGFAAVNTRPVVPAGTTYPEVAELVDIVGRRAGTVVADDFTEIAAGLGSVRVLNVLLLGIAAAGFPIKESTLSEAVEEMVKPAFREMNRGAFSRGTAIRSATSGR